MSQATGPGWAAPATTARERNFTLAVLTVGHGATHLYNQGFQLIVAAIKEQLGLSATAADALISARQLSGAVVNAPAGIATDLFRNRWNLILALSLAWMGIASLLIGLAPTYVLLLFTVALLGIGGTTWHMPAITALSERFPDRKGFALSTHGVGGSAGDAVGPLMVGALLVALTWRDVLVVGAIAPILLGGLVFVLLRGLSGGASAALGDGRGVRGYLSGVRDVFRNRLLIMLAVVAGVRSMAQTALTPHLTFYLKEDLGLSSPTVGAYVALLTALGIVSSPVLGTLSDRIGRKPVLLVGMSLLGVLSCALAVVPPGWPLAAVIALMGLFLYSLQAIVVAAAMDLAGERAAATTVGFMFTGNRLFSGFSPTIAGVLVDFTGTNTTAFYYTGVLMLIGSVILAFTPLRHEKQAPASAGPRPG